MREPLPAPTRALAAELVTLRQRAGLSTRAAAALLGMSPASLDRAENARRAATVAEVSTMLVVYDAPGAERARLMAEATRLADGDPYQAVVEAFRGLEADAARVVDFETHHLPGSVQTAEYGRAFHEVCAGSSAASRVRAEVRAGRLGVLADDHPPGSLVVLDEASLRRPFGGTETMVAQLHHLVRAAGEPHVALRVIPFRHGAYANPDSFTLFDFPTAPPVVFTELVGTSVLLDRRDVVAGYRESIAHLVEVSLDSADTVDFLHEVIADYGRE